MLIQVQGFSTPKRQPTADPRDPGYYVTTFKMDDLAEVPRVGDVISPPYKYVPYDLRLLVVSREWKYHALDPRVSWFLVLHVCLLDREAALTEFERGPLVESRAGWDRRDRRARAAPPEA